MVLAKKIQRFFSKKNLYFIENNESNCHLWWIKTQNAFLRLEIIVAYFDEKLTTVPPRPPRVSLIIWMALYVSLWTKIERRQDYKSKSHSPESKKFYQIRNLSGEDEIGHGPDPGDDGDLAQEEQERNNLVQDDNADDVSHQTKIEEKKIFIILTIESFCHTRAAFSTFCTSRHLTGGIMFIEMF